MINKLSSRLLACSEFITPGDKVADIGCDHGYLGIYLLQNGLASYVYAADVNEGPLQSALNNAKKYGIQDRISFYLSDGVQNVPQGFDTMVCAGMGADTMISILEAAPWLKSKSYKLILQCQSKTHTLRKYLYDNGWYIREETVIRDGRFLYTVMEVLFEPGHTLTPGNRYFSPALLVHPAADLPTYYGQVLFRLRRAVAGQKENANPVMVQALRELENDPALQFLKEK